MVYRDSKGDGFCDEPVCIGGFTQLALLWPDLQGLPEDKQQALKKVVIADVVAYDVVLDYPYWPVGKSFISSFFSTSRKHSKL